MKADTAHTLYSGDMTIKRKTRPTIRQLLLLPALFSVLTIFLALSLLAKIPSTRSSKRASTAAHRLDAIRQRCASIKVPAGPPLHYSRSQSDRYVPGTAPVLIRNAKILTGARNGTEVVHGDVFLDKGLVKAIGYFPPSVLAAATSAIHEIDAKSAWITPGLVDLHSHIGVSSSPELQGSSDTNSRKAPILPWLRSIDGLNTHDASYELAISGGVTTVQILPGSANNIGGQAYVIKLRPTDERSVTSKVVEPPQALNGTTEFDYSNPENYPRWRHMKHACGENPSRVYSQTRMDSAWNFRSAYDQAQTIRLQQDAFCAGLEDGSTPPDATFPENLQWEALVDVLRGRVKLSIHCYEAVDLDAIIRLSNEFKFPIASLHHAGETYLVPDLLKQTWGGTPSIALFASNFRKKREAYRGSEFAPGVLSRSGIPVVMKSDHPVVNSRYLMYEAQQAHYFGLHDALAIAAVTSTPAAAAGLAHRVGILAEGYDADLVIWDSHPLQLGATPKQVYIDGIPQLNAAITSHIPPKSPSAQRSPKVPDFRKEARQAVEYDGLPPLEVNKEVRSVVFANVSSFYWREGGEIRVVWDENEGQEVRANSEAGEKLGTVVVKNGHVTCFVLPEMTTDKRDTTSLSTCLAADLVGVEDSMTAVDLKGGSLVPGLTTFGAPIGLVEIRMEDSTNDGDVLKRLSQSAPSILGNDTTVVRAVDGLLFGGRNTLLAYRSGVTTAVTAPTGSGTFILGLSTVFAVDARHALENRAILQAETALHVEVQKGTASSVSTQIGALRRLLLGVDAPDTSAWGRVRSGSIPLVVNVDNSDIMATLILLKAEVEHVTGQTVRLTFAGAAEAHLLAKEIATAGVSVIINPSRPFPGTWDQARILPGPPLSRESAITTLLDHGVKVGLGVVDESSARLTRFDITWAALESGGKITRAQAIALASTGLEVALGIDPGQVQGNLVAYQGGWMGDFDSETVALVSSRLGVVKLL